MRSLLVILALVAATCNAATVPGKAAPDCDPTQCNLPSCRCFQSLSVPGNLQPNEVPQLVLLTFDDAVSELLYNDFYSTLQNHQNPNGCPISATFFMAHEYTDYSIVNLLYNMGHEIAIHSITHTTTTQYWSDATVQTLNDEFAGERQTIAKFANIPEADVSGVRTPFLVLAGDNTFQVMEDNGLYDVSWPTQTYVGQGLYPYTLDYSSKQDCPVGTCPKESHPGTWVLPMIDWIGDNNFPCAMADTCQTDATNKDELLDFIKGNFDRHYNGWREPFGFFVHAAWFQANATNFEAYKDFLAYLGGLNDVYIVSTRQAVAWTKTPTNVGGAAALFDCPPRSAPCVPLTCQLTKPDPNGGLRYMKQCVECPPNYPWLGNPLGE